MNTAGQYQPGNTDEMNQYTVALTTPAELVRHNTGKIYTMTKLTPKDFMRERGGIQFDYDKLKKDFAGICEDYNENLYWENGSYALDFCSRMLFEVAPESRSVKKATGDKMWKFVFPRLLNGNKSVGVLFVSTYKAEGASYVPSLTANNMSVPVKQACLLAMETLAKVVTIGCLQTPVQYVLTPLAGAVFSRNDIVDIAKAMGVSVPNALNALNESCQSGGHHLAWSDITIAVLAAVVNTRKLIEAGKNQEAGSIITKITKQYVATKKESFFDKNKFIKLAKFANGGVPKGLEARTLIKMFGNAQALTGIKALRASEFEGDVVVMNNDEYFEDPVMSSHESEDEDYKRYVEKFNNKLLKDRKEEEEKKNEDGLLDEAAGGSNQEDEFVPIDPTKPYDADREKKKRDARAVKETMAKLLLASEKKSEDSEDKKTDGKDMNKVD